MRGGKEASDESLVPDFPEDSGCLRDDGTEIRYLPWSTEVSALGL